MTRRPRFPGSPIYPLAVLLWVLLLAGCTGLESRPADQPAERPATKPPLATKEPSPSDVFDSLEKASQRLALEEQRDAELEPTDLWARLIARFEIAHCPEGSRAARWAAWYSERPDYMDRVMQRARPWLHDIANEIESRGLPGELALLPIVESAYDPFAYSHGRAAGSWQFLASTARDFGIEINDWYDGRRDVYASTRAALDYLSYLSELFDGDWSLALAAYNAGQGRVQRAMRRNAARGRSLEYQALPLPAETLSYVPKLNGLGCLFREPEAWGFQVPELEDKPRFARVELPGPTDVVMAAAAAGLDMVELVSLNPGLNRHMTPPSGPHYLVVPPNRASALKAALGEMPAEDRLSWQEILVRRGDTLSGLAQRHNTSIRHLREVNGLNGDHLDVGQRLRLPVAGGEITDDRLAAQYEELAQLQQRLLPTERFRHRVRPGESLWTISRRYGVSVANIQRYNGLGASTMIHPGQQLLIETGKPTRSADRSIKYTVRSGDSLWTIARRHQVAMNDLMRWNNLSADSILRPGQQLTIRKGSDA